MRLATIGFLLAVGLSWQVSAQTFFPLTPVPGGGSAAVSSVTNSDNTLTCTPTTGAVGCKVANPLVVNLTPPADLSGLSAPFPCPTWYPVIHQQKGGTNCSHGYLASDQLNAEIADTFALITNDASVLTKVGFGAAGAGNVGLQVGLQFLLNGTTYNEYVTIISGDTNTTLAQREAATINGSLISATVDASDTSSTAVNGATYALNLPQIPAANGICYRTPNVIVTASAGKITALTPTTSQGGIWDGVCPKQITNPVGLVGIPGSAIDVVQGDYAFVAADAAATDSHGQGHQPNAFTSAGTIGFDFPWYNNGHENSVFLCAATVSGFAQGSGCPTNTGTLLAGVDGYFLDVNPLFTMERTVPGRNPAPTDEIGCFYMAGDSSATTPGDTQYAQLCVFPGDMAASAAASPTSAGSPNVTLVTIGASGTYNGLLVTDTKNPSAIPPGTTILSGGGTTSIVLSNNVTAPGIATNDSLVFVDPTVPVGTIELGVTGIGSSKNSTASILKVCGGVDCSGFGEQFSVSQPSLQVFGGRNAAIGSSVGMAWGLETGTLSSFAFGELLDNNGAPTYLQVYGAPVVSATEELTTATNGGSYAWKNITTTWATLTGTNYTLGSGVGLTVPGLATAGTIAGAVCATSAGAVLYEAGATGCTISLEELKHDIAPIGDTSDLMALKPISFGFNDPKMPQHRYGFGARQVASVDAALSTVDGNGKLQAYDPNGILALTVAAVQRQQWEIRALMAAVALLALWCAGLTIVVCKKTTGKNTA
jgi:hypothetical protein